MNHAMSQLAEVASHIDMQDDRVWSASAGDKAYSRIFDRVSSATELNQ
jgi:hypothetical protein